MLTQQVTQAARKTEGTVHSSPSSMQSVSLQDCLSHKPSSSFLSSQESQSVLDPDLEIRGPRSSRPLDKGWGKGGLLKKCFRFGPKIKGGPTSAVPPPFPWVRHGVSCSLMVEHLDHWTGGYGFDCLEYSDFFFPSACVIAFEQALRGTLVAWREKEGELATTSLEFEYLHRKSRCEMLIGGDVFSNDIITHVACFHVFFNVCLHSRWFRLRADWFAEIWQLSRRGTTGELEVEFKFQRRSCKLFFLFPPSLQSAPESLLAGHLCHWLNKHLSHVFTRLKIHHHISIIRLKCMAIH